MAKYCLKCGKENKDSSSFCESCGEELPKSASVSSASDITTSSKPKGGWWSQQSTGVKAGIVLGGLCCVGIIVVIVLFGMFIPDLSTVNTTSSNTTSLTQTFSQSGLTFNYPSDWERVGIAADMVSGGSGVQDLVSLLSSDGEVGLTASKADLSSGESIESRKEITKNNIISEASAQVLSENKRTVNGVTIYEVIFSLIDPTTNQDSKIMYVVTGKDNQVVYYVQFIGNVSEFDSNKKVMDDIVNTIKIQ